MFQDIHLLHKLCFTLINCANLIWLVCADGDVHLSGGEIENEGTVEICFDNLWGLVSQNEWSTADAEVTCRQLGYPSEGISFDIF